MAVTSSSKSSCRARDRDHKNHDLDRDTDSEPLPVSLSPLARPGTNRLGTLLSTRSARAAVGLGAPGQDPPGLTLPPSAKFPGLRNTAGEAIVFPSSPCFYDESESGKKHEA